jgi:hypothetical protein
MASKPLVLLVAACALVACHHDAAPSEAKPKVGADAEKKADAPGETKPVVDQRIANAVAAAEKQAQAPNGQTRTADAPPQDGILGAGAAAKELAPGSPASVVLGADGTTPRVRLGADRLVAGAGLSGKLELSYRAGGSVMPTLDIDWRSKTSTGAEALKVVASEPGTGAGSEPTVNNADAVLTRFSIVNAVPAAKQPGRLPDDARSEIQKLKGSSVDVLSTPRGALQSERLQVSGKNPDLAPFVQTSAQALASVALAYPDVPVGVGAYWMVKSRELIEGSEVLAYRMVKLTGLSGNTATLDVQTRRYLINPSLDLEGLPPHAVRQFQGDGSATLSLRVGAPYPSSADIQDHFMALISPNDRPAQAIPVQSELTAKFSVSP